MSEEKEMTLEDALLGMLGEDEPEEEESTSDESESEKIPEPEEGQQTDDAEEGESEAEPPADEELAAKLEELETKYGKPEENDPWVSIKNEEQALIQEKAALEQSFLTGLPDIKNDSGTSIYQMPEAQFDEFLQQLDDDGKERLKIQAVQAREKAIQQATQYQQRHDSFQDRIQQHSQAKLEMEVITDIAKQLGMPDVVKKYQDGSITRLLTEKAKTDPSIAQKAGNKEGLYQLAIMAIRDLKLVQSKDQESTQKPSAPDAKTVSKKVKTKSVEENTDEALLAKVSKNPKEWDKLDSKVRERLMYASIRDQL